MFHNLIGAFRRKAVYKYDSWSVTSYFANDGQAKTFWANTSDNEIIREVLQGLTPEVSDELTRIMQDEEIHAALNMEVVYPKMADGADTVFSFLLLMMLAQETPVLPREI